MSRAGIAMRSDVLRAMLQVTTTREQLVAAGDTLLSAVYALGWLTGADGPVGAKVDSTSECLRPLALDDSAIVFLATGAAPSVTAAQAVAAADRAALRAARTQYIPTITATGGYNWAANSAVTTGGARPGWTVSLGTSYPIFNGFQREDFIVRAAVASDVASVAASDARRSARASAAQLLSALRTAETSIVLAADAVRSAREDLRVQTERFRAGISTMLDVLTSESALVQAEYMLVSARHRYNTTRAALEALVGRRL
jgi:outer membrane protein